VAKTVASLRYVTGTQILMFELAHAKNSDATITPNFDKLPNFLDGGRASKKLLDRFVIATNTACCTALHKNLCQATTSG
jgi:hypothetical protein